MAADLIEDPRGLGAALSSAIRDHRLVQSHPPHSGIHFLTPADVHCGRTAERLAERRRKLAAARHARREQNLYLRQRTLALADRTPPREPYTSRQPELSHFA